MSQMTASRFKAYMDARAAAAHPAGRDALDLPLRVTFFRNYAAATKTEEVVSLRGIVDRLRLMNGASKADLPWLKLASFGAKRTDKGSLRNDGNVIEITGIEADYDGESITLERARQVLAQADVAAVLYTSPSHTEDAPRWRILCPTSRPLPPAARADLVARVNGLFVGALARESFTLSQSYYYGFVTGSTAHAVVTVEGRAIDLCDELAEHAVTRQKPEPLDPGPALPFTRTASADESRLGRAALDERCDNIRRAPDGAKHHAINEDAFAIGGLVARGHLPEAEAWGALSDALAGILPRCKDPRAAQRTLRQAFQQGMARPQHVDPPQEDPPLAPAVWNITRAMQARLRKAAPPAEVTTELMDAPGALGLFVDYCDRTAISPQPFLALAAGIAMVGALAGRRYRTSTDLRTNIYVVGIADSGAGKDHPRKQSRRCLHAANAAHYLGGSDIASGSGLRTALIRHPAMLFQIDEFGDWLAEILGERASTHKKQIASMLKELYSSASMPWAGIEYANQSKRDGQPREDVQHPHCCLYGSSTPGQFWGSVAGANLHDGLLARMILFVSPCSYPDEREPELADPPPDLIAALQAIAAGAGADPGNLTAFPQPMPHDAVPEPYTVPETPGATEARRALRQHQLTQQRQHEGTYVTAIAGRLAENAMKLALVRAVSRHPARPVIQADDVAWGRALAQHCVDTLLREASRHVADSDYERKANRALDYIRKHQPISERAMINKGWRLPERERQEILRTLVEGGLIMMLDGGVTEAGGRPTVRYAINEQPSGPAIETPFDGTENHG